MTLSSKDIKRVLERHGFVLSRQRGSHQQFVHESTVYGALANVNRQDEWIPSFERKTCGSEGSFSEDACTSFPGKGDGNSGLGLNLSEQNYGNFAPVAQLDRAPAFGAGCREFESLQARSPVFSKIFSERRQDPCGGIVPGAHYTNKERIKT